MDNIVKISIKNVEIDNPILVTTSDDSVRENVKIISDDTEKTTVKALGETVVRKGYSPYVNRDTGTWFEYDEDTRTFVDTHIQVLTSVETISNDDILFLFDKYSGKDGES